MAQLAKSDATTASRLLDEVFGANSKGTSPEERAKTSKKIFIRSQHQLSLYADGAKGRQLNATEALRIAGWDRLKLLADRQAVPILENAHEPYATIESRLQVLNLDLNPIAKKAGWDEEIIKLFRARKQVPFRKLERLAQLLALDEQFLGTPGARADDALGVRLRELRGGDATRFTQAVVLGLAEAGWVVRKQLELGLSIGVSQGENLNRLGFTPDGNYGSPLRPAWRVGYELARKTRRLLGLSDSEPVESLKESIEGVLKIPVIQVELPEHFAGATIANGDSRGIVINLKGDNGNVWVRRMTLAHELGHLLWDPDDKLRRLIVDQYSDVMAPLNKTRDFVEMRANAFAIEFLLPQDALREAFESSEDEEEFLQSMMLRYGVSKTAAIFHLENAYHGNLNSAKLSAGPNIDPTDDWIAREETTVGYFNPESVPISRRGYFAAYVARAADEGTISEDSVAALLACEPADAPKALKSVRDLLLS